EGLIFHRSALERLRLLVAQRKSTSNRLDVAAFKETTGLSRKYAIPLLEYLDRERVTRRKGAVNSYEGASITETRRHGEKWGISGSRRRLYVTLIVLSVSPCLCA